MVNLVGFIYERNFSRSFSIIRSKKEYVISPHPPFARNKADPSFSLLILAGSSCQSLSQMKFGDSQTKVFEMNASTICAPLEDLVVPLLSL